MRRQQLRIGNELWCVASWNHDGYVTKTWCDTEKKAETLKESLLRSGHWESVSHPIGPFKLTTRRTARLKP